MTTRSLTSRVERLERRLRLEAEDGIAAVEERARARYLLHGHARFGGLPETMQRAAEALLGDDPPERRRRDAEKLRRHHERGGRPNTVVIGDGWMCTAPHLRLRLLDQDGNATAGDDAAAAARNPSQIALETRNATAAL